MKTFYLLFLILIGSLTQAFANDNRPNIIMMLDDLGYSDLGCYGSEIKTPNIDKLAAEGMRFRSFYNTAKCHSSRVSLLTGLYSDQAGDVKMDRGVTIAEVLKSSGYSTSMVGKWHLTKEPTDRGFSKYFGHLSGATNFFKGDNSFRLNGKRWDEFDKDFYTTDANIKYAKQFLTESLTESPDKPFFLYIAHNAPHYLLHVRKEDFNKYKGVYEKGWDEIRAKRLAKQKEMKLIPEQWTSAPRPNLVPEWSSLSENDKLWESRRMMAYAGMVDRVDQTTGDLIEFLKEKKIYDNTIIMICSDNGACPFDRTKRGEKDPWNPDSYWCYDTGWSHVGNTPFRLHKQNQHAGGISSPLIVHWPQTVPKNKKGSITTQRGHLIDFMATCIDLAQADYPKIHNDREVQPYEGISLVPIIKGQQRDPHSDLFFRFRNNRAIIQGDWKLVTLNASTWELYNIVKDGTEMNNLAKQHPEKVEELKKIWLMQAKEKELLKGENIKPVSGENPPLIKKNGIPTKH